LATVPQAGFGQKFTEYEAKAAYLYKIAHFVDFAPNKFESRESPFIFGVLGEDPFKADLDRTISGEKVDGRPIEIRRLKTDQEARNVHVLFISNSEKKGCRRFWKN